jgi:hypothetical protein
MRDALPILYRLVDANLEALGGCALLDLGDQQVLLELAAPHLSWLFKVTEHLAKAGDYTCVLRPALVDRAQALEPPFHAAGVSMPLRPHGQQRHTTFAVNFGRALTATQSEVDLRDRDAERQRAWLARWIAAAALTAHLALLPGASSWRVSLEAPLGEDEVTARAGLMASIAGFPSELIQALPVYMAAQRDAYKRCCVEIALGFASIGAELSPRVRYEMAGRTADLIAFCASVRLPGSPARVRRMEDRARQFLVRERICDGDAEAKQRLLDIGIADPFQSRNEGRADKLRFPTKNAENQAAFRGKAIYLEIWGRTCVEAGVLTPALIHAITQSRKATKMLMSLISAPGGQARNGGPAERAAGDAIASPDEVSAGNRPTGSKPHDLN